MKNKKIDYRNNLYLIQNYKGSVIDLVNKNH
jgi:hypothetical protein